MGAIVMDKAFVSEYCLIAAGAVVLENTVCEAGHIYAGTLARKIKPISAEQRKLLDELPLRYVLYASWFELYVAVNLSRLLFVSRGRFWRTGFVRFQNRFINWVF